MAHQSRSNASENGYKKLLQSTFLKAHVFNESIIEKYACRQVNINSPCTTLDDIYPNDDFINDSLRVLAAGESEKVGMEEHIAQVLKKINSKTKEYGAIHRKVLASQKIRESMGHNLEDLVLNQKVNDDEEDDSIPVSELCNWTDDFFSPKSSHRSFSPVKSKYSEVSSHKVTKKKKANNLQQSNPVTINKHRRKSGKKYSIKPISPKKSASKPSSKENYSLSNVDRFASSESTDDSIRSNNRCSRKQSSLQSLHTLRPMNDCIRRCGSIGYVAQNKVNTNTRVWAANTSPSRESVCSSHSPVDKPVIIENKSSTDNKRVGSHLCHLPITSSNKTLRNGKHYDALRIEIPHNVPGEEGKRDHSVGHQTVGTAEGCTRDLSINVGQGSELINTGALHCVQGKARYSKHAPTRQLKFLTADPLKQPSRSKKYLFLYKNGSHGVFPDLASGHHWQLHGASGESPKICTLPFDSDIPPICETPNIFECVTDTDLIIASNETDHLATKIKRAISSAEQMVVPNLSTIVEESSNLGTFSARKSGIGGEDNEGMEQFKTLTSSNKCAHNISKSTPLQSFEEYLTTIEYPENDSIVLSKTNMNVLCSKNNFESAVLRQFSTNHTICRERENPVVGNNRQSITTEKKSRFSSILRKSEDGIPIVDDKERSNNLYLPCSENGVQKQSCKCVKELSEHETRCATPSSFTKYDSSDNDLWSSSASISSKEKNSSRGKLAKRRRSPRSVSMPLPQRLNLPKALNTCVEEQNCAQEDVLEDARSTTLDMSKPTNNLNIFPGSEDTSPELIAVAAPLSYIADEQIIPQFTSTKERTDELIILPTNEQDTVGSPDACNTINVSSVQTTDGLNDCTRNGSSSQTTDGLINCTRNGSSSQTTDSLNNCTRNGSSSQTTDSLNNCTWNGSASQTTDGLNNCTRNGLSNQTIDSSKNATRKSFNLLGNESSESDLDDGDSVFSRSVAPIRKKKKKIDCTLNGSSSQTTDGLIGCTRNGSSSQTTDGLNNCTRNGSSNQTTDGFNNCTQNRLSIQTTDGLNNCARNGSSNQTIHSSKNATRKSFNLLGNESSESDSDDGDSVFSRSVAPIRKKKKGNDTVSLQSVCMQPSLKVRETSSVKLIQSMLFDD